METAEEDVVKSTRLREKLESYRPRQYKKLKQLMKQNEPLGDRIDLTPAIELLYYIYEKEKMEKKSASSTSGE